MLPTTGGWTGALRKACVTALHLHTQNAPLRCWPATSTGRIGSRRPTAWLLTLACPLTLPVQLHFQLTPATSPCLLKASTQEEAGEEEGCTKEFQASGSHARRTQSRRHLSERVAVPVQHLPPPLWFLSIPWVKERSPKEFWNHRGALIQFSIILLKKTLHPSLVKHMPTCILTSCLPVCHLPPHSVNPHLKCPKRAF